MAIRKCGHCHKALVRREGEKPSLFKRRRFCDARCGNQHRSQVALEAAGVVGERVCLSCGRVLVRKKYRHNWESVRDFAERQYCGPSCMGASRRGRPFSGRPVWARPGVVWSPPVPSLVGGDPRVALREALRVHPELVLAFEQVERDVSLDSWEPYSQAAVKGVSA